MSHWQDDLCPYCGNQRGGHFKQCKWPDKLALYEARAAAGEDPVVPDGIPVVVSTFEDLLAAIGERT